MIKHDDIYEFLNETVAGNREIWLYKLIKNNFKNCLFDDFIGRNASRLFTNIYIPGSSNNFIIAHYDVVNPMYCANDNSASVINALIYKQNHPEINVAILDGEEPPHFGEGSRRLAEFINNNIFNPISNVFNLELTGVGDNIYIGKHDNKTSKIIKQNVKCIEISTPFCDSDILIRNGINSEVIFLIPTINGKPSEEYISYCHTSRDNASIINIKDMINFTDNVLPKIING